MLKIRSNAIKLSSEYLESPAETVKSDVNHLCLKKGPSGSQVVFCITNKSSGGDVYSFALQGFEPSDEVVEVIGCKTVTADATGAITAYMGHGEPKAYVLASALKDTGLCPETEPDGPKTPNAGSALGVARGMAVAAVMGCLAVFLL